MNRPKITIATETAPAYWIGYLINGDPGDMTDAEIAACDAWVKDVTDNYRGDVTTHPDSESYFGRWRGDWGQPGVIAGDLEDYAVIFHD